MGSVILESGVPGAAGGNAVWTPIWSKSGNLGDQWNQALVFAQQSPTMLRFTYTSGSSYTGDFALDDIQLGDCLTVGCSASPNSACMVPGGSCDHASGRCAAYADGTTCESETTTDNFGAAFKNTKPYVRNR